MNHATEYRIIYTGLYQESDFRFEIIPGKRRYKAATRKLINEAWIEAKLNPNLDIFNGRIVSLISIVPTKEEGRDIFHLKVQMTDYKSFYGTNISHSNYLPKCELANALAVCAVVETKEGTVFTGKRNLRLAETSGVWHVPGGTFNEVTDPITLMKRELLEELNITDSDIQSALCLGFGENLIMKKPEFMCYFHLNISEHQLTEKIQNAVDAAEHTEYVFVPVEELVNFIEVHPFAPIGKACIRLYLEHVSGKRTKNLLQLLKERDHYAERPTEYL